MALETYTVTFDDGTELLVMAYGTHDAASQAINHAMAQWDDVPTVRLVRLSGAPALEAVRVG